MVTTHSDAGISVIRHNMINKDNIRVLLEELEFVTDTSSTNEVMVRRFHDNGVQVSVDLSTDQIIYPKGLKIERATTINFSDNENFVVLECVCQLLKIGYHPSSIVLEPKTPGGREDGYYYGDILIKDNDDIPFMLIECKTAGEKYENEWHRMLRDGGQLFRYYNSYRPAKYICLYTADIVNRSLQSSYRMIKMTDNENRISSDKDLISYASITSKGGDYQEYFRVWKDTYEYDYLSRGGFEQTFHVRENAYGENDLRDVDSEEIKKKYNEFAVILRQHNVGSHENAFDKLVNLFLAKVVDETNNPNNLHFYWKGTSYDDDFSLQDRLQRLYRDGMKKFLGEEVTYIENSEIDKAFRWVVNDVDATKKTIKEYFRALKFFSDNDFAFISVHNKRLFKQNAEVLRKVVKMLQGIRLRTKEEYQNQLLGDLFEGFLTKGVKQSEGQYFTPMPIVRFIVSALPLERIISQSERIPACIDYACGAGHFLTEYAIRIKEFVEKYRPDIDIHEYYKHITGIEKEYRLSKVSKVSAFMYGHDETRIIYADALKPHDTLRQNSYDVLIANPPYSVTGFLETLNENERSAFSLYNNSIDTAKNNAIETFFIERSAQLLRSGGVAGIVLPVSVLNRGGIYARAREIILENFDIVSLAEFGSGTFGKTGTNTVILFLRRKETVAPAAEHFRSRVKSWFTSGVTEKDIYQDTHLLQAYCDHCGYEFEDYRSFLRDGTINEALSKSEIFKAYRESFDSQDRNAMTGVCDVAKDIRNRYRTRIKTQNFNRQSEATKKEIKESALLDFIVSIEKEKVYIFLLAYTVTVPVLTVKSPAKTAIKRFLGYEWSDSKGNEGIEYLHLSKSKSQKDDEGDDDDTVQQIRGINGIRTPLFNPNNLYDPEKINTLIRQSFLDEDVIIPEDLSEYVSQAKLVDMIDFFKASFNKVLKTTKVNHRPKGKFDYIRLETILAKIEKANIKVPENEILQNGKLPVITQERGVLISGYTNLPNGIKAHPLIVFGDHSCTFKYVDFDFVRGADGTQLIKSGNPKIQLKYLYHFLSNSKIENADRYERHFKYLKDMWIPMADEKTQTSLIQECDTVDEEVEEAKSRIADAELKIEQAFSTGAKHASKLLSLNDTRIFSLSIGRRVVSNEIVADGRYRVVSANVHDEFGRINHSVLDDFSIPSVLWGIDGDWLVNYIEKDIFFAPTDHCGVIRVVNEEEVLPKYLTYPLLKAGEKEHFSRVNRASTERVRALTITVPDIDIQKTVVEEVCKYESVIAESESVIAEALKRKQAILDKYLK